MERMPGVRAGREFFVQLWAERSVAFVAMHERIVGAGTHTARSPHLIITKIRNPTIHFAPSLSPTIQFSPNSSSSLQTPLLPRHSLHDFHPSRGLVPNPDA